MKDKYSKLNAGFMLLGLATYAAGTMMVIAPMVAKLAGTLKDAVKEVAEPDDKPQEITDLQQ